jgi:hypothetical protein
MLRHFRTAAVATPQSNCTPSVTGMQPVYTLCSTADCHSLTIKHPSVQPSTLVFLAYHTPKPVEASRCHNQAATAHTDTTPSWHHTAWPTRLAVAAATQMHSRLEAARHCTHASPHRASTPAPRSHRTRDTQAEHSHLSLLTVVEQH